MTAGMDTEVLIIPANVIAVLKEQKSSCPLLPLWNWQRKRFSDVMWAMQQIMFKGLDRRLADFLLAEAERTGSDTIRMTHEQIAQHISSAAGGGGADAQELLGGRACGAKTRRNHAAGL